MQPKPIADLEAADPASFLQPTPFLESDSPAVVRFAQESIGDAQTDIDKGVRLFYAVRDGIRYNPYNIPNSPDGYRASTVLTEEGAFCIPKSCLLAAAARSVGIPALVGFADVKNHLNTEKLRANMDTDLFVYHGYTVLWLDGMWVKATAAFNLSLCEKFGVLPLEFDGRSDAMLHPFDAHDRRHMEYVQDRGIFAEIPYQEITEAFHRHYPGFMARVADTNGYFEDEKPLNA